jgi:hypothetical protein
MSKKNNRKPNGQDGARLLKFFNTVDTEARDRLFPQLTGKEKKIARATGFKPKKATPPRRSRIRGQDQQSDS